MPQAAKKIDPLAVFLTRATASQKPLPLVATRFDLRIAGGLTFVATRRTYRNSETNSIEAVLTFPLPVHAMLFSLQATIAGRVLKAQAQARAQARETYEDALSRGKTAVLHEELLRGIHMLSVGHIAPGAEIVVDTLWAMPLTEVDGVARLRIPLTVGEVYGDSGLAGSDALRHGGLAQSAEIRVFCEDGTVTLGSRRIGAEPVTIPLDAPLDLAVTNWMPRPLQGVAADGRGVTLTIAPRAQRESALDTAILIDHSGSMSESFADSGPLSKHAAVLAGLDAAGGQLQSGDHIDLWEFDNAVRSVGSTARSSNSGQSLRRHLAKLSPPSGGTEIGAAIATVLAHAPASDILLITDGKSHALDVQSLAASGRRISVVLIGEDSLEAQVGYLATLSGGDIFIASGADASAAILAALKGLRAGAGVPPTDEPVTDDIVVERNGMRLHAQWAPVHSNEAGADPMSRAVAVVAASLLLPRLGREAATTLAVTEGLVTHLTSLVLIDEAGTQEGIPAMRKIALPAPRTMAAAAMPAPPMPMASASRREAEVPRPAAASASPWSIGRIFRKRTTEPAQQKRDLEPRLRALAHRIDWDADPNGLASGNLASLDPGRVEHIRRLAQEAEILSVAKRLKLDPIRVAIGLLARAAAVSNRSAARIATAILGEPVF